MIAVLILDDFVGFSIYLVLKTALSLCELTHLAGISAKNILGGGERGVSGAGA
jgi:hypothetical protein